MRVARPFARAAALAVAVAAVSCGSTPTSPPVVPRLLITKILAFGDSLTEGDATPSSIKPLFVQPTNDPGPAKGYPYKLLTLLSQRYTDQTIQVYNGGFGGRFAADDATGQPPRDLIEFLDAFHPEVMILMHGANDLNQPSPNVQAIANFVGALMTQAQSHGTAVIMSSLPPRIPGGTPPRAFNPELVPPFNAALQTIAVQHGAPFIDVYTPIVQNLAGPDMAPDGLHLTQAGNDKLAAIYFNALKLSYEARR